MKFPLYIAIRYLFSKKTINAINLISIISIIGVSIGTAALIIILSVFNGFDNLLKQLYSSFDPDIKIVAENTKFFIPNNELITYLNQSAFIDNYSLTLEENAMIEYDGKQVIASIKGVDNNYNKVTGIDTMLLNNYSFSLYLDSTPCAIVGRNIAYNLRLNNDDFRAITIYVPSRTKNITSNIYDFNQNVNSIKVYYSAIFSTQQEYDNKYIIIPISTTRKLLEYDTELSSIEIKLKNINNSKAVVSELKDKFNNLDIKILDRNLQHEYVYKVMQSEKWAIFMILVFIIIIASFNIIGSLTMLIIEKKTDIFILKSLGANNNTIRNIFFCEGIIISLLGTIIGLIFGSLICLIQIKFGIIKLGESGSFIIDNYPVAIQFADFLYVFISVMLVGIFAAWYPIKYIMKKYIKTSDITQLS